MNVGSLSSAAFTALNRLGSAVRQIEQVADEVAKGVADQAGSSFSAGLSGLVQLRMIEQHAKANAAVFSTATEMLEELSRMPRL